MSLGFNPYKRVTFSTKGQVVIPKCIRKKLKLEEGSICYLQVHDGRIFMYPVCKPPTKRHTLEWLIEGDQTCGYIWRAPMPAITPKDVQTSV
jgi:AbrB family looped-hinge helix DNA binding protein